MSQISRLKDTEISNGNLIDADDLDAEFNQLISAHNTNDTELTSIGTGAYTFTGVKTFSSTPKMNAIDERTAASGVTVDSVLLKDGMVTVAGTPTVAGQIGYASNTLQYYNGSSVINVGSTITGVESRSSNTILAAADDKKVIIYTGTFTQTYTAAATLGAKWYVDVRNDGTGIITHDFNGSETGDGKTTLLMYQGESYRIVCDGSNFKTIGRSKGEILIQSQSASNSTSIDFTAGLTDTEFKGFKVVIYDLTPATDSTTLYMRISDDAGSTFEADATDYEYFTVQGGDDIEESSTGAAQLLLTPAGAGGPMGTAAGEPGAFYTVETHALSGTSLPKNFFWKGTYTRAVDGAPAVVHGSGRHNGDNAAVTGLRFLMNSGNITSGTFELYGVR